MIPYNHIDQETNSFTIVKEILKYDTLTHDHVLMNFKDKKNAKNGEG